MKTPYNIFSILSKADVSQGDVALEWKAGSLEPLNKPDLH